jgi:outer membrane protein assembly factor BamA
MAPFPVADFGHILAVFADVGLVIDTTPDRAKAPRRRMVLASGWKHRGQTLIALRWGIAALVQQTS